MTREGRVHHEVKGTQVILEFPQNATASTGSSEAPDMFGGTGSAEKVRSTNESSPPSPADFEDSIPESYGEGDSQVSSFAAEMMSPHWKVAQDVAKAETVAKADFLRRQRLSSAVCSLLTGRKEEHPLALVLFGAWGTGKTSFIEFLKDGIRKESTLPFRFAEFNAWRNERVDNVGAALSQAVVESLVSGRAFSQQLGLAYRLARKRNERLGKAVSEDVSRVREWFERAWFWLGSTLTYVAWPLAVASIFLALLVETQLSKVLVGGLGTVATVITTFFVAHHALSKELLDWFKKLAKDQKFTFRLLPDYAERLGSYHEMGRTLQDLCALTLGPGDSPQGESLLLVIDDLDRCSPDTIKQVFDAVRLVANIPRVVVLVALDERIAYSAVAKHYAEYGFSDRETAQVARDYLSKVFNVFVTLPAAQEEALANYVKYRLFDIPEPEYPLPPAPPPFYEDATPAPSNELEATAFAETAAEFNITNPRELWRLRQAWSLLKAIALSSEEREVRIRDWMRHMFFREVFLRGTAEQRKNAQPLIEKLQSRVGLGFNDEFWQENLTSAARHLAEGFHLRDPEVMAVLLPAAPAELKVSKS